MATARYQTVSAYIIGGICGDLWMPNAKAGKPHRFDVRRRIDRFSDSRGITFRDILLAEITEAGGDFQCARFTADSVLVVVRESGGRGPSGRPWLTRVKERAVATLPDCADMVDAEAFTYDFEGDE